MPHWMLVAPFTVQESGTPVTSKLLGMGISSRTP